MDEQTDWAVPLAVVATVVAITLAGVLALAVAGGADDAVPQSVGNASADEAAPTQASLVFDAGSAQLPAEAQLLLGPLADEARAAPAQQRLFIQVGHDGSEAGHALARQRGQTLRHALEANGVPPQRMHLVPGAAASGPAAQLATVALR